MACRVVTLRYYSDLFASQMLTKILGHDKFRTWLEKAEVREEISHDCGEDEY